MKPLAKIIADLPIDNPACITPTRRVMRDDLLEKAKYLRESGSVLADPLIDGSDIVTAMAQMIALDGYVSALFLVPADMDDGLRAKVREIANNVRLLRPGGETKWIMATSGTTGTPKLVSHSLRSLTRSLKVDGSLGAQLRWALLYDPCRFAGLQVTLQACISGSVLLVPGTAHIEDVVNFLNREICTSISATPSMWRKMLSVAIAQDLKLRHVTLGGEIADEKTLQRLRLLFPEARITHIYASTEAGVGFSVKDCKAGFPVEYLTAAPGGKIELKISDHGNLLIRGQDLDQVYVNQSQALIGPDGFINTGDLVELRGGRVFFRGRANGSINVGGQKVMPEEVENVLRNCPEILDVRVYGKPSPVLGTIVAAEVVACKKNGHEELKKKIKAICQKQLETYKRPALIRIVDDIELTGAGKIKR